ncbi:hypothetical protein ACFONC_11580 [Luteimonas soli]|uniref:Uncharacterized protein n=1 Tax=Luteimonas soli TaxID=1648966 RepID=A0ABV7XKW2_9GAMM
MIPGLLHRRLLMDAPAGGIIASPVYQTLLGFASASGSSEATVLFNVNPDGTWTGSGTGYPTSSGAWFSPIGSGAGDAYEVRITPTRSSASAGVVANTATGWVALSSARQLSVKSQRFTTGLSTVEYSVVVEIRITGGAIVSTGVFDIRCTAEVATGGGGGTGCPAVDMCLSRHMIAGAVEVGQAIDGVLTGAGAQVSRLVVLADAVSVQPCYRIATANGAACVLSESTPFTMRDGSTLYASQMLGQEVLRDHGEGGLVWDVVTECHPVGAREVVRISVGGHSLLAGENPLMRIVSHNQSKQ